MPMPIFGGRIFRKEDKRCRREHCISPVNFIKGNLHTQFHPIRRRTANRRILPKGSREEGYSLPAITDHWIYGVHEELNREDFLVFPGTELDLELPERKDHHLVSIGLPETNRIPDDYRFERERTGNTLCTPRGSLNIWQRTAMLPYMPTPTGQKWILRISRISMVCWEWKSTTTWQSLRTATVILRPIMTIFCS